VFLKAREDREEMRIVYIIPGSGGTFYCQNCMRDVALVHELQCAGHEVLVVPMYLPLFTDEKSIDDGVPVFFGGINVYLQQKFKFFRKTPRWVDRIFDSKWVLRRVASREGATSAAGLGPMTLSMLRGADGNQRKELARLVDWLTERERPDLVHISNALLIGLASALKAKMDIPVVCTFQDEDTWLDAIDPPFNEACWTAVGEHCGVIDRFIAVSEWYAERMSVRLNIERKRISVIPVGIDLNGCHPAALNFDPPTIGYLSRMSDIYGLGRLVEAFIELKQKDGLEGLKLKATGGMVGADRRFVAGLKRRLDRVGFADDVCFVEDFSREERIALIRSLSVLSVPVERGEAFGTYIIEALACGVPVVQPRAGAFPELIDVTGGGIIYDDSLSVALERMLRDPECAGRMGSCGREIVHKEFDINVVAERILAEYVSLTGERK
jgi:glycosyltransferase involved in cell wall biosynthesis